MANITKIFERLHKRPPTDEELGRIYEMGGAVDALENDTFLSLIVLMDFYHESISKGPEKILTAVNESSEQARKLAQTKLDTMMQTAIQNASAAIADSAKAAARGASIRSASIFIGAGILLSTLAISAGYWTVHKTALEQGVAIGRAEQRDEEFMLKKSEEWIGTDEGKKAYIMHEKKQLEKLLNCSERGWKIEERDGEKICFPLPDPKNRQYYGWKLP